MDPSKIIKEIASQASGSTTNSIVDKVVNYTIEKFNCYQSLNENMDKLKRKREELSSRREDVESKLEVEHQRGKRSKKEVELWLANVQKINDKIQAIENEVGEVTGTQRVSLGERVAKMIPDVEELYHKGSFSDGLVLDASPRKGEIFPSIKLAGETTAMRNMEEIWDNLMNDVTRLIGVYGMGGSGKTTVMKEINNRLVERRDKFDRVVWITVSKVLDVIKLQDRIAKEFGVDLSGCEDEAIRVARLFTGLNEKKRYVLILDDLWEAFELERVGIPEPTIANECKIVLTTRFLEICRNMRCKDIKMELLLKDEAWNLFLDIVGLHVSPTPNLEATMRLVAEECACLPLAIVTMAGSMKGVVDECEWSNTLEELREDTGELNGMEKVLKQLEHSYLRLEDEKLRHCLLYCALYPEDFAIQTNELIKFLISEGIIEGKKSRRAEFNKGQTILNKLENACLLEICSFSYGEEKTVKMHDLIRDMAHQIMSSQCMVQAGVQLTDLPDKEKWTQDIERVSLRNNNIREIRSGVSPRCDKLSTLLLSQNKELRKIPNSFFLHMVGLRVLDLSHTGIENLPNSISDLENLVALVLRRCEDLKYVPSLAKLSALRMLDLGNTGIEEVPHGLEMLVNLRCLDLNVPLLKMLPIGILPKLSHLQCLIVWWGSKTLKVKAEEVAGLRQLEAFAGQFDDPHDLNTYIRSWQVGSRPHRYLLQVGPGDPSFGFDEGIENPARYVILRNCSISRGGGDPLELPNDITHLDIKECHDVISLCDVSLPRTDFLRWCKIKNCDGIEYLISSSSPYYLPLQCLEYLQLGKLRNLHVLFKGEGTATPPPGTFSCLVTLIIKGCPSIKKLFTPGLLPHLQNLKSISVENCEGMEEIIGAKSEGEEEQVMGESSNHSIVNSDDTLITFTLPKLYYLSLANLPELKSIVYGRGVMVCDSLQHIIVHNCPKLKKLPFYPPVLNGNLLAPPPGTFSLLKALWITDCPNIKKLFTPGLLPHLQNLKSIYVQNCEGMEEIIAAKSEGEEEQVMGESSNHSIVNNDDTLITFTLPKLYRMYLENLPELKSIVYGRGVMVCDSLEEIVVRNCPKLKRFPLYLPVLNGKPSPPNLGSVLFEEGWWESLEWDHPDAKIVLQPLVHFYRREQPIR